MAASFVQLPDDSINLGKKVRTNTRVVGADTVHEHYFLLVDSAGNVANLTAGGALEVNISGSTGVVDTELPAAASLSNFMGNPTAPAVGAFPLLWDAGSSVWRRWEGTQSPQIGAFAHVCLKSEIGDFIGGDTAHPIISSLVNNELSSFNMTETTVGVTTSSSTVLAGGVGRQFYLFLQNVSDEVIHVNVLGNTAVVDQCVKLYPGWSVEYASNSIVPPVSSAIKAIHAGSGTKNLYILYSRV